VRNVNAQKRLPGPSLVRRICKLHNRVHAHSVKIDLNRTNIAYSRVIYAKHDFVYSSKLVEIQNTGFDVRQILSYIHLNSPNLFTVGRLLAKSGVFVAHGGVKNRLT